MIKRLRDLSPDLAEMYPEPHDHRRFGLGHFLRVELTVVLAAAMKQHFDWVSVADLSCGNGEIAKRITADTDTPTLGDFAPGYSICGPIEDTLPTIAEHDLYICSETIEHLDDPLSVLTAIRSKAKGLILSTPIECWNDDNDEHLWAWDREGIEYLLIQAGWDIYVHQQLDTRTFGEPYLYGIWAAI